MTTRSLDAPITEHARRSPELVAVAADPPSTFAELDRSITAFAERLRAAGIEGGRVGLLLPNVPAFPAALHGILRAGASAVMLNPLYSRREIGEYAGDARARGVVTIEALEHLVPDGVPVLAIDSDDAAAEAEWSRPPAPAHQDDDALPHGDREAVVIYTAATGGWARGARLTHRSLGANLRGVVEAMQLTPEDCVLGLLPYGHAFGLTVTLNAPLAAGARVIPFDRFHPVRVLELMERHCATLVCGVPAMFVALVAAAEKRGAPKHSLRMAICGGAPLRAEVSRRWEEMFGLPLREGYGLTEASPVCLFNRADRPNRPGTLGYAFPGVDVTIRDAQGGTVGAGETGEICVEGANLFAGYIGEDGRDGGRWWGDAFRTGDRGSMEPDGAVRFRGVIKRMFTRGGFNVYPAEVERVLTADPRIQQACVATRPDPVKENEIILTVVPAPGAELDEDAVKQLCREALAAFKQPGTIVIERDG
ncbi:MAG TPA: AMP-binding protein [Longimicrobium sp.]|nr:AMP-binding protein [Longimicrobium sp.]